MSDQAVFCLCFTALAALLVFVVFLGQRRADRAALAPMPAPPDPTDCTPLDRVRQFLRRLIWPLLFVGGAYSYPWQVRGMVWYLTRGLSGAELASQRAALYGKFVDPLYFYSKASISMGLFTLANGLAWGALLVTPVLIDWATGYYKQERAGFPETRGFKGTFLLRLTDWQRMLVFILVWALEMETALRSITAGFTTP